MMIQKSLVLISLFLFSVSCGTKKTEKEIKAVNSAEKVASDVANIEVAKASNDAIAVPEYKLSDEDIKDLISESVLSTEEEELIAKLKNN